MGLDLCLKQVLAEVVVSWKENIVISTIQLFIFFLVLDAVLWQRSEVPFCILLALEISPGVFAFALPLQQARPWACTTTHLPSPLELLRCPCYKMVLWEMVCRNKSGVIFLF